MNRKYKWFYFLTIIGLIVASFYPLYAGGKIFWYYSQNGFISKADYGKYIIPYAPICISLIICTALYPLLYKLLKRYSVIAASTLAIGIFYLFEIAFEHMRVLVNVNFTEYTSVSSWQLSMCVVTPEVLKAIEVKGQPVFESNNPVFKVHFYLISIIIILTYTYLIYGYTRMFRDGDTSRKKPLFVQLVCTCIFVGLCILACFTAFFRTGTINISPLSAILTSMFFIVFGMTFGVYIGCILTGKIPLFSIIISSVFASLTTLAMYFGELTLLGGSLYRLGNGILFYPINNIPFALMDIIIILLSGIFTYFIMCFVNKSKVINPR